MERVSASTAAHCSGEMAVSVSPQPALTDYSPRDSSWDLHRGQADDVGLVYAAAARFERYAARMASCGGFLRFGWLTVLDTGVSVLRLREARFCRVRHCPVCQWRRSLMWQARFYQALPGIVRAHPSARWLFLTLTVRNCPVSDLGETLTAMNAGWQRYKARKEFRPVLGWVRTTEVTRGRDGLAHPHFHALLMVRPSMLTTNYVKQSRWIELWRESMRLDYDPVVDVRTVKNMPSGGSDGVTEALQKAVAETLKYSVKPSDMTGDADWFLELTSQTHKRRFVAAGGALKDVLRLEQETDADLLMADGVSDGESLEPLLAFNWRDTERRYRRAPAGDVMAPRKGQGD